MKASRLGSERLSESRIRTQRCGRVLLKPKHSVIVGVSGVIVVITGVTWDTDRVREPVETVTVGSSGETAETLRKPSGCHLATCADWTPSASEVLAAQPDPAAIMARSTFSTTGMSPEDAGVPKGAL